MSDIQRLAAERRTVVGWLWAGMVLLTCAHVLLQGVMFKSGHDSIFGLLPLFDLDAEANIPTWFSTILLLAAAMLLAWIWVDARIRRSPATSHWLVLAIGFLCMSIDEASSVHNLFDAPTIRLLGGEVHGALLYAWVIPYTILVLALGAYFLRFLWQLPRDTRLRFLVAGGIFVSGALGIEFLEGVAATSGSEEGFSYAVLNTLQEVMEMAGVILFIDALLRYIRDHANEPGTVSMPAGQPG